MEITQNNVAQQILLNGYQRKQQNHLYILVGSDTAQQKKMYKWYICIHLCKNKIDNRPCMECESCQAITHGNYVNSIIIRKEPEKKSLGIEAVKQLQSIFTLTAEIADIRFFCIEDADLLTNQAASSILKFLEEPRGETVGFLFVKNEQNILPTIRSRSQILRLQQEAIDLATLAKIDKKISNIQDKQASQFLLEIGYDSKFVLKHVEKAAATIENYISKMASGSPAIVAQTVLENFAVKTKTGMLIFELFTYMISMELQGHQQFQTIPPLAKAYLQKQGNLIYIALYRGLQQTKHHMSVASIMTYYTLEFEKLGQK
ncbi:hypothetical protein AwErysi_04690 [Erysipelotrichaceae bacterium]|nr:hypothetical protein AwErysi_04690 [Erysipelotrichaceae bacterium]